MARESSKRLQDEMNRSLKQPKSVDQDKAIFEQFKKGMEWKDESLVKNCVDCGVKFTMVTRKHHCRECGDVFCNNCSSHQIVIHGALKRCCSACYRRTVAESNQSMIGNHLDMDYDDNIVVGGSGSFASHRSASFAKAVHMVDKMRESESPSKKGSKGLSGGDAAGAGQQSARKKGDKEKSAASYPPWLEALVYVAEEGDEEDFDDSADCADGDANGNGDSSEGSGNSRIGKRCVVYPSDALPACLVEDIVAAAIPAGPVTMSGGGDGIAGMMDEALNEDDTDGGTVTAHLPFLSLQYMFRTHDKTEGGLVGVPSKGDKSKPGNGINPATTTTATAAATANGSSSTQSQWSRRFGQPRIANSTVFYNGFVCFRAARSRGPSGETVLRKHSLVLISKWPFPQLAYYAMKKLDVVFRWSHVNWGGSGGSGALSSSLNDKKGSTSASAGAGASDTSAVLTTTQRLDLSTVSMRDIMKKCYAEFGGLPGVKGGGDMLQATYLGELLQYRVPVDINPLLGGVNLNLSAASVTYNLVQHLAPLGLVQHLFTLWELVASGRDIVVVTPHPAYCASLVLTLSSLLSPLGHNGVVLPYVHAADSDLSILAALSRRKQAREVERSVGGASGKTGKPSSKSAAVLAAAAASSSSSSGGAGGVGLGTGSATNSASVNDLAQLASNVNSGSGGGSSGGGGGAGASGGGFGGSDPVSPPRKPKALPLATNSAAAASADGGKKPVPASAKRLQRLSSTIVGVTSVGALAHLSSFDAALFVQATPNEHSALTLGGIRESLRRRNRAPHLVADATESLADLHESWLDSASSSSSGGGGGGGGGNDDDKSTSRSRGRSGGSTNTKGDAEDKEDGGDDMPSGEGVLLVTRSAFDTELDREVIRTIQNMDSATSMRVLGDKLIRDRLNALTIAYYTPEDGTSLEVVEMRLAALEKAVLAEEQRQVEKVEGLLRSENTLFDVRLLMWLLATVPSGIPHLVPTFIMWLCYACSVALFHFVLEVRADVVLMGALLGHFPVLCPKKWERVMRIVVPKQVLYPLYFDSQGNRRKGAPKGPPASLVGAVGEADAIASINPFARLNSENGSEDSEQVFQRTGTSGSSSSTGSSAVLLGPSSSGAGAGSGGAESDNGSSSGSGGGGGGRAKANLSGVWKRTKTVDYDKFIMAQGGSWIKSRMAGTIALVHTVTMDEGLNHFRLAEKGGPINTDFSYAVDGTSVHDTTIGETKFKDTVSWTDDNALLVRKLVQPGEGYELLVKRFLDDASHLRIVATYNNFGDSSKNVTATSYFEKDGPSPKQAEMDAFAAERAQAAGAAAGDGAVAGAGGAAAAAGAGGAPATIDKQEGKDEGQSQGKSKSKSKFSPLPSSPSPSPDKDGASASSPPGFFSPKGNNTPVALPGPSTGATPSTTGSKTTTTGAGDNAVLEGPEAFKGRWQRSAQINYSAVLELLGLEEKEVQVALSSDMTITATTGYPSSSSSGGSDGDKGPFVRLREQTGGLSSSSSGLTVDCTYDLSPFTTGGTGKGGASYSVNNLGRERRESIKAGGVKLWGQRYFESVYYGPSAAASMVGSSSSKGSRYGDVLTVERASATSTLRMTSKYCVVTRGKSSPDSPADAPDHLKVTTVCRVMRPKFSGGPMEEVTVEATSFFDRLSTTVGADFTISPSDGNGNSGGGERTDSVVSATTPASRLLSIDGATGASTTSTSSSGKGGMTLSRKDVVAAEAAGMNPEVLKKRRLISGMWTLAKMDPSTGMVVDAHTQDPQNPSGAVAMQEILFNQSMTKIQIGDISSPPSVGRASSGGNEGVKTQQLYKVDADKGVTKELPIGPNAALVSVTERCEWDSGSNAALVITQLDVKGEREISYYRFVEKGGDESSVVAASTDSTKKEKATSSKVFNVLRVKRIEKNLRTMATIESERVFKRKIKT